MCIHVCICVFLCADANMNTHVKNHWPRSTTMILIFFKAGGGKHPEELLDAMVTALDDNAFCNLTFSLDMLNNNCIVILFIAIIFMSLKKINGRGGVHDAQTRHIPA